jgi:hypothetical protein
MTHLLFRVLMNLIRSILQHTVHIRQQLWPHLTHRQAPRTRCPTSAGAAPRARAAERRERAVGHVRVVRAQHAECRGGERPEQYPWADAALAPSRTRTSWGACQAAQANPPRGAACASAGRRGRESHTEAVWQGAIVAAAEARPYQRSHACVQCAQHDGQALLAHRGARPMATECAAAAQAPR